MSTSPKLKAPFPWFGGKARVASMVWERFGAEIGNYMEPFFGSGAVLLGRPGGAGCMEQGDDPLLRIALCGYAGEGHEELEARGWRCVPWKAHGGYGGGKGKRGDANALRERIWFSPHCLESAA